MGNRIIESLNKRKMCKKIEGDIDQEI